MQVLVGLVLTSVIVVSGYGFYTEQGKKLAMTDTIAPVSTLTNNHPQRELPTRDAGFNIQKVNRVLALNSGAWTIVMAAKRYYNVPADVVLAIWFLESGMRLGGDRGGAGGNFALAQIIAKQSEIKERHRWHRFIANHRDILKICRHCGYDCNNIQGSTTGALGPMQFQPSTWILGAIDAGGSGCPLDLRDAIFTAARKLSRDRERLGGWDAAIMAYAGSGPRARDYLRRAQRLRPLFIPYINTYLNTHLHE